MTWWSRSDGLTSSPKRSVPKGVFQKCGECNNALDEAELAQSSWICSQCGGHLRMPTRDRIHLIIDTDSLQIHDDKLLSKDPLGFEADGKAYSKTLAKRAADDGPNSGFISGTASIEGQAVEIGWFVFEYLGGSMGSVVGEKIARQFERSLDSGNPAIIFSASGGARMQEGMLSLMQMAKISAARYHLRSRRIPFISVLLHPTTGGVAASVAMLGDIILTEPGTLVGFAGPRVIEQTIGQALPKGFQRAEFLLEHGMIDQIVHRTEMRAKLSRLLQWLSPS